MREGELFRWNVPHRFQLLAELRQASLQLGMAESMTLPAGQIEQVGYFLGVDAEHRRVLHPVGSGHHAEHPLRRRHRAAGQVGGRTLRGLPRLRHDHARAVAKQLQRVAGHGVERLDAALVQHRDRPSGTPVVPPLGLRPLVCRQQAEQSHERQRDQRHDQIGDRGRGVVAVVARLRHPISGPAGGPPLVAARRGLTVVRFVPGGQAPVVAVGKPQERAAEVGEHAP